MRTFTNKPGVTFDALKTTVVFAEDLNEIIDAIESDVIAPVKATGAEINTGTDDSKFATAKAIADSDIAFLSDIPTLPVKATGAEVDTGTNDTKFVTPKAMEDSSYAKLSDIPTLPVKATGAEINTGTDDAKFTTAKAIADSDIAFLSDIPTLPVKATGAEINTGTDDSKFATAKAIADSNISFPTKSETYTNKRITKRVGNTTSSATPTINTDTVDIYLLTAQTADITSFTTYLSGTPTQAQTLWISITGTGARAITWGASFEASTVALPTTTVTTARLDVGFVWNTVTNKWRCVAVA